MAYKYKIGLQGKTALVLGALIFAGLFVSIFASYWQSRSVAEQKVIELQQSEFAVLRREIEYSLDDYRKNLLSLLGVPPIQAIIRARANNNIDPESGDTVQEWRQRMLTIFGAFLTNHPEYLQIRIIDTSGDELVRVQSSVDGYSVVGEDELQNKSGFDYVTETVKLQRGEIYHADISLNREHGAIELPVLPVLRLATPIHDANEQVVALIVINVAIEELFRSVSSDVDGVQRTIVDERGNYIKHSDAAKVFGFDLPVVGGFQVDEPELAQLATRQDQFMRRHTEEAELDGFQKIYFSPQDHSRYWLLTLKIPESVMFKDITQALNKMLIVSLGIGVFSLVLIYWFISRKILKPVVDLAVAANRLRRGDLTVRVDAASTRDEFYTLYSAINAFAENQQRATEQLDAQAKRLAAVIDNVAEGIVTIDVHGAIESVNPATCRMFGYHEAELLGQNVKILMPEIYHIEHDAQLQSHIKTGNVKAIGKETEKIGQRKDGSTFAIGLDIREFWVAEQCMYIGVARDITEHNKAQSQLIAARVEAEAANQAKTEFLSSMSHELRTPLNAILGFGQLLDQSGEKASAEDQRTFVQEILKAGNHLLDLVSQVLDLSRIEEGHLDLQIESIQVGKEMEECISQLQVGLPAMAAITLINELDYRSPKIAADRMRLKQVIINLLSNAVKYNREGGAIIIRSESTAENRFRISIADTGVGISQEGIRKLFDPFERLAFKHGSIEGAGIGLTVSKRLIEAMHGSLGVDSTKGKGSIFWFELPLATKHSSLDGLESPELAKVPELMPRQSLSGKPKVLHIEDNPANVLLIKEILDRRSSYQTLCSTTAEEGLTLARKELPDIILMDIKLPGMDGHAALQILKSDDRTCHIPVIAISADPLLEQKQGFDDYLVKPININRLYEAVEKHTLAASTLESEARASNY